MVGAIPELAHMLILDIGSRVTLAKDIEATITAVQLMAARDSTRVDYRVVWWHDGKRCDEWVHEYEAQPLDGYKTIDLRFESTRNLVAP